MTRSIIIDFERQNLDQALRDESSLVLIAVSEIATVTEFCPASERLPKGISLIERKRGDPIPVKGTPAHIRDVIARAIADAR